MKLFISYSSKDKVSREEVSEYLEDLDHTVWADKSLKSGQEWWNEILEEIRISDVFITLLSKNYDSSSACESELHYAIALNKYILPIKIEALSNELLPYDLGKLQVFDYFSPPTSKRITGLVNALASISSQADYPRKNLVPLPEEPSIPISYKTRIYNRLDVALELDVAAQKEIISELRKGISTNQSDHAEIKILLEKMLKRGDEIRLNISYEIKELLEKIEQHNKKHTVPVEKIDSEYFTTSTKSLPSKKSDIEAEERLNIGLQVLSFVIPFVGFLLFYIYKDEARQKANRGLMLGIVGFFVFMILGV